MPIGVLAAIYVERVRAEAHRASQVRLWLDVLNGFPSIVIGIFVFALVVKTKLPILDIGHHQSAWAGGFALSIIMLPLVARTTMEVLALVPNQPARGELRARRLEVADGAQHRAAERARRHRHRDDARRRPRRRRDGAAALHLHLREPARHLEPVAAGASIPFTIFSYSESPDAEPARAGLGGGLPPDRLRARRRASTARALLDRSRRKLGAGLSSRPSPHFVTSSSPDRLSPSSRTRAAWPAALRAGSPAP